MKEASRISYNNYIRSCYEWLVLFTADCNQCYRNWPSAEALHVGFTADHGCYQRNLAPAGPGVRLITISSHVKFELLWSNLNQVKRESDEFKFGVDCKLYVDEIRRLLWERKCVFTTVFHWFIVIRHLHGSVVRCIALMLMIATAVDKIRFVETLWIWNDSYVARNSQHHKTQISVINTGHILLLKY